MTQNRARSGELYSRAKEVIPGGVNSPVRAFKSVDGDPLFIEKASGPWLWDVDGNQYLDFVGSWGPMILGHSASLPVEAVREVALGGTSFGAPCELEVRLAEELVSLIPCIDQVRMVSSGTEATMSAIRLARAYAGKKVIIKCDGCYHGHSDSLLVKAGSGVATYGIAGSPGVCEELARLTVSVPYNDIDALKKVVSEVGADQIAAFIVEPVPGNMGLVIPEEGYLDAVRTVCSENKIVLIFDEVMSGFRVALGGAVEKFGVEPDLLTYGKVIGGGLPVGAFAGRKEIMSRLAPEGNVYQAGTLSGNPLAMAAGLATLLELKANPPYETLESIGSSLVSGLSKIAEANGLEFSTSFLGSMFGIFFTSGQVKSFADAQAADQEGFKKFFWGMLERGFYFAPSAFEAGFVGTGHTAELVDNTLKAAEEVFAEFD